VYSNELNSSTFSLSLINDLPEIEIIKFLKIKVNFSLVLIHLNLNLLKKNNFQLLTNKINVSIIFDA
jgi:hypothetical protein